MKITLESNKDNVIRVLDGDNKFIGIIKHRDGHMLCYYKNRHTTTQSLKEVIQFFNGDFQSYYYRGNER